MNYHLKPILYISFLLMLFNISFAMYDTRTGRFMQQDPMGINPVGGEQNHFKPINQYLDSGDLYEYILSNPLSFTDPSGLRLRPPNHYKGKRKRILELFMKWYEEQKQRGEWWTHLPKCPLKLCMKDGKPQKPKGEEGKKWKDPGGSQGMGAEERLHPEIKYSMRSESVNGHSNQCTYDKDGNLYPDYPQAGTVDWSVPPWPSHLYSDVYPLHHAVFLDYGIDMAVWVGEKTPSPPGKYMEMYYDMRPLYAKEADEENNEECCPQR